MIKPKIKERVRKFSFSAQLVLLISGILLFVSIVFTAVTIASFQSLAKSECFDRLSTVAKMISQGDKPGQDIYNPTFNNFDMDYEYYKYRTGIASQSDGLNNYITSDELNNLINTMQEKYGNIPANDGVRGKITTSTGSYYYYANFEVSNFQNYTIVFTTNAYVDGLVRPMSFKIIVVFLVVLLIAMLAISWWSNSVIKRIKLLQYHIEQMPKNKYEKEYLDKSLDEIGQLSVSVEKMRTEISHNEATKQEMLQNLSHDFKTPIAVIKSYAEAIQDGVETTESLNIIIEQADLLKNKVIKLLQYNSLEYLDHSKPFEHINMAELIQEVLVSYKYQTNLKIVDDLDDSIFFDGYRENWTTVISNILDNAKRYAKSMIKISLKNDKIYIYNDGEHIDEVFIKNSFKAYEKGSKGQFGLGMSIVVKTCNFFGYSLSVQNEEPTGVTFVISK
ncbi:MAG: HAMP domain-containing histidine kinase [Acholeplasmatales bacterium]|nr:HAMP domain-containing histidine kinase [Acholeplasmatales bacterium]